MDQVLSILLLIFGFGFVIFFHELGHFLAAKWVGIKVEQFAVGFGQAILSWRKGMGVTVGSSGKKFEELEKAGKAEGISETEYRLNWIPLGGYVKMLGQDDLKPNAVADDPRAYNKKTVAQRMLVVSAGVIMNIILAAIGFMVVFMMGFRAPPAVVGSVVPNSPASKAVTVADGGKLIPAPLAPGDRILLFDDKFQHDFTKITLNVALAEEGVPVPVYVERVDGTREWVTVVPERASPDPHSFLMLGIGQPYELRGMDAKDAIPAKELDPQRLPHEMLAIRPGDTIVAINDQPVEVKEYYKLEEALQASGGEPIELTVRDAQGAERVETIRPLFAPVFGERDVNFAGMLQRPAVYIIQKKSPAVGKLLPGDAITSISTGEQTIGDPTTDQLIDTLNKAGSAGGKVTVTVMRDGQTVTLEGLEPSVRLPNGNYGLSIQLAQDVGHAVVAGTLPESPAAAAGVPQGARITAVNGQPVEDWGDVKAALDRATADEPVKLTADVAGESKQFDLKLAEKDLSFVRGLRYTHGVPPFGLALHDRVEPRKAANAWQALQWGVVETRDFVMQFYLTLQRMVQGSVSYKNMMGPVGIFDAGRRFAYKGNDWLIWFLSMISANLAVVNFLPIPIVDGGLFLFLIIEKIQGRPVSPKTQSIAQVVGLAVILSVFLLVTYQDIARFL